MFNKSKRVLKHYALHEGYPELLPAKSYVPEWYKKASRYSERNVTQLPAKIGFKSCQVFSDTFTTGYMLSTPVDLAVEQTPGGPSVSWQSGSEQYLILRENTEENKTLAVPLGCHANHFAWQIKTGFKVPKGYSALLTHPINRPDIPFVTLSGILDGEITLHPGNIPVFFKEGFEGVIPAGTPFMQVIPFKRESWKSEKDQSLLEEIKLNQFYSSNTHGWYKKVKWSKKYYE
jgi:hypothetical protein